MPEKLLDGAQIPAIAQQMRGEAMPQRMRCGRFRQPKMEAQFEGRR